jgi:hypothetical protein
MTNVVSLDSASKKHSRRQTYPAGWAYNTEAIAELADIKARLADPLLEARSAYCRQLFDMDFTEVVGELQTVIDVVVELKFDQCAERRAA